MLCLFVELGRCRVDVAIINQQLLRHRVLRRSLLLHCVAMGLDLMHDMLVAIICLYRLEPARFGLCAERVLQTLRGIGLVVLDVDQFQCFTTLLPFSEQGRVSVWLIV